MHNGIYKLCINFMKQRWKLPTLHKVLRISTRCIPIAWLKKALRDNIQNSPLKDVTCARQSQRNPERYPFTVDILQVKASF